ncbi:hypothetical protein Salat_1546400 [Sesamum alatum]|uniref:Uncharacterized protein n=1 Tax=Sesamum alatum TaxID=300844 RepID=A0AAE2CMX1_9LAMI|nr:hypothetical protein Salat_1546400 [Sesamum alatum]
MHMHYTDPYWHACKQIKSSAWRRRRTWPAAAPRWTEGFRRTRPVAAPRWTEGFRRTRLRPWPRRKRLIIPTQSIDTKAWKSASVLTPPTVKRVSVCIYTYSPAALPGETAPDPTQTAVVDVGIHVYAAVPTAAPPDSWGVVILVANPRPEAAAHEAVVLDSAASSQPWGVGGGGVCGFSLCCDHK